MRAIRLIIAGLLAASLTILPLSAGMAMANAAKSEMSMSASVDDCPCCNPAKTCAADHCLFACYNAPAISAGGLPLVQPPPQPLVGIGLTTMSPFLRQPDPPPPRS